MRNLMLLILCMFALVEAGAQSPTVSFVVSSQTCGESVDTFWIAVEIQNYNSNPTSVNLNVVGGTAVYGTNFTFSPVPVTFPGGVPFTQLFPIVVIDDSVPNGDKTVTFGFDTASATNGATIGSPATFTLTMTDFDTPKLSISPVAISQSENIGMINVQVTLNRGVRDTTKVQLNLVPNGTTAVNGVDFAFNNTTLVWPPDSDGTIVASFPVINNPFYEPSRTVELGLTNATNGAVLSDTNFTLTILANALDTAQGCSDLFFGQYVQGAGSNQALQIFNPTAVPIDLSVYSILKSANGGANITAYALSGTIQPRGVFVLANPGAEAGILSVANAQSSFFNFDGTEALALLHLTDTVDIIGQLYVNPGGSGWPVGNGSTVGNTLIRNYYDYAGSTNWANGVSTWNVFPDNMIDSLGFHHADSCGANGPVATVRYPVLSDTIAQSDTTIWIHVEVNNPTADTIAYTYAVNQQLSTAVRGYNYDYYQNNFTQRDPPGVYNDSFYIYIFRSPELISLKSIVFDFISLSPHVVAIPDTNFTLYLANNNKFTVSFLGAGYAYPKGSGRVEIPVIASTFSSVPTTVDVSLSSGSAVEGTDFLFNDTTITFPAFSPDTQGAWVTILNNNVYEGNKQANFNLSNATNNAILGITGFTLTIINDDSLSGIVPGPGIENDVRIMPNPVISNLLVQTGKDLIDVEITVILGNRIADLGKFKAGRSSVDVSSLSEGIYLLNIREADKIYFQKFIKIE